MSSIVTLRRAAFGAVLLLSAITAVALASPLTVSSGVKVEYGDLDPSQPKDAQILYRRISNAARRVCNEPARGDLTQMNRYRECYAGAVSDAVAKVNENTLTALHRSKTQRATAG